MLAPGLFARCLGPHLQPSRAGKPGHHPLDSLGQERVAAEAGDLDVKISAGLVPFLARHLASAGVEHLRNSVQIGFAGTLAGEPHGRDFEGFAVLGQRFDFAEIDRSDRPIPEIPGGRQEL